MSCYSSQTVSGSSVSISSLLLESVPAAEHDSLLEKDIKCCNFTCQQTDDIMMLVHIASELKNCQQENIQADGVCLSDTLLMGDKSRGNFCKLDVNKNISDTINNVKEIILQETETLSTNVIKPEVVHSLSDNCDSEYPASIELKGSVESGFSPLPVIDEAYQELMETKPHLLTDNLSTLPCEKDGLQVTNVSIRLDHNSLSDASSISSSVYQAHETETEHCCNREASYGISTKAFDMAQTPDSSYFRDTDEIHSSEGESQSVLLSMSSGKAVSDINITDQQTKDLEDSFLNFSLNENEADSPQLHHIDGVQHHSESVAKLETTQVKPKGGSSISNGVAENFKACEQGATEKVDKEKVVSSNSSLTHASDSDFSSEHSLDISCTTLTTKDQQIGDNHSSASMRDDIFSGYVILDEVTGNSDDEGLLIKGELTECIEENLLRNQFENHLPQSVNCKEFVRDGAECNSSEVKESSQETEYRVKSSENERLMYLNKVKEKALRDLLLRKKYMHITSKSESEDTNSLNNNKYKIEEEGVIPRQKASVAPLTATLRFGEQDSISSEGEKIKAYLKPFISDDPVENQDNYDPGWDYLQKLKTDEQRYRIVRQTWKSLQIPDPNMNLSYHGAWRRKNGSERSVLMNLSRKRKRIIIDEGSVPYPCQKRARKMCNLQFNYVQVDRALSTVNANYSDMQQNIKPRNCSFAHLCRAYNEKTHQLEMVQDEVNTLHRFYSGLPDQVATLSQEGAEDEQVDIENLYEAFKVHYNWDGREFNP